MAPPRMASRSELQQWTFMAGVVGGALMIAGTVVALLTFAFMAAAFPFGGPSMMGGAGVLLMALVMGWAILSGLVAGTVVIVGATRVRRDASAGSGWGIAMIVAGALAFFGGGGFFFGSVLAIVAGVLAMSAARAPT